MKIMRLRNYSKTEQRVSIAPNILVGVIRYLRRSDARSVRYTERLRRNARVMMWQIRHVTLMMWRVPCHLLTRFDESSGL